MSIGGGASDTIIKGAGWWAGGESDVVGDPLDLFGRRSQADADEATQEAADLQEDAELDSLAEYRRQFDVTQANLQPWLTAGTGALTEQQALLGLSGQEAQQAAYDKFKQDPGQAFLQQRAQKNLVANASAIGELGGGNVRSDLVQQGVGFGQQDFGNYYNRLAGISGTGQQTGAQLGQFGSQFAGNAAGALTGAAQARASGILGMQQNAAQQQQQATSNLMTVGSFFLSEEKSKENINDLNLKECYENTINMPLKSWSYLKETGLDQDIHFGPMVESAPDMIKKRNMISLHDELMMIAGALQYMKNEGMLNA